MEQIEIIKPDDWHVHFRDGEILKAVVPESTRNFARSIVMPNLVPPIINGQDALQYKKRIKKAVPNGHNFEPFMTIYLTENTNENQLEKSYKNGDIFAAKLYPAGATTNSESGVKDINKIMRLLEKMALIGMPLLIHGEITDKNVDIFDREKEFIDRKLDFICRNIPDLKITLEHITTKEATLYVSESKNNLAATITPHHLALNRNAMFVNGIKPHNYCLPILKRQSHQKSLIKVATSGNPKFFLGSDTAPHLKKDKENACGCAGVFNSTYCLSILANIFEKENSIEMLESFVSINGAKHYGIGTNKEKIKLIKSETPITLKSSIKVENEEIIIFKPDFPVFWKVIN